MRTGYEMAGCEAANAQFGAASQFLRGAQPRYRLREFTRYHLHFHGSSRCRGETDKAMEGSTDNGYK